MAVRAEAAKSPPPLGVVKEEVCHSGAHAVGHLAPLGDLMEIATWSHPKQISLSAITGPTAPRRTAGMRSFVSAAVAYIPGTRPPRKRPRAARARNRNRDTHTAITAFRHASAMRHCKHICFSWALTRGTVQSSETGLKLRARGQAEHDAEAKGRCIERCEGSAGNQISNHTANP